MSNLTEEVVKNSMVVVVATDEQVVCKTSLVMFLFVARVKDPTLNVLPHPLYAVSVDLSHRVHRVLTVVDRVVIEVSC